MNEIALTLSACHLKFPSCSLPCLFSRNFHLETAWHILGTRSKQQPGWLSATAVLRHFWKKKKKKPLGPCVGHKVEQGMMHFISTSPHFPREFFIPLDFSASTQAMLQRSCTMLHQLNLCPRCPTGLCTFKQRTACTAALTSTWINLIACYLVMKVKKTWALSFW